MRGECRTKVLPHQKPDGSWRFQKISKRFRMPKIIKRGTDKTQDLPRSPHYNTCMLVVQGALLQVIEE